MEPSKLDDRARRMAETIDGLIAASPEENKGAVPLVVVGPTGPLMGAVRKHTVANVYVMTTQIQGQGERQPKLANLYFTPETVAMVYEPIEKEEPRIVSAPSLIR